MKDTFLTRILLALALLFSSALAAQDDNLEYKVKAGYLYNFTKFITWPDLKAPSFNLCLVGQDPFGTVIIPIETKTAFAKPIKVIRLDDAGMQSKVGSIADCQILYIDSANALKKALATIKSDAQNTGILLVGSGEEFAAAGGMIAFVNREGRIKLQINQDAVRQSGLKISAKLLEIAELVEGQSND